MPATPLRATRRTTLPARRRAAAAAALAVALTALVSCSDDDGGASTTTEPVTTTTAAPLDPVAEELELAYLSFADDTTTIFLADGKGASTEPVARIAGQGEGLRWAPQGDRLLLDADGTGDFEVFVVDVETGEADAIASSPTSNEGGAVWSPDGERVAFFSNREGQFAGYVVDLATDAVTRFTPEGLGSVAGLAWSPDGSTIAFSVSTDVDTAIWTARPDGTDARQVSTEAGSANPAWAPDGSSIAIASQPLGQETSGIALLDPEEGTTETVVDTAYRDSFPTWRPDGGGLYFISALPNEDADGGDADDILQIDLEGGEPEQVIGDGISIESEVDVSPGGELIAFSVQRLGDKEVFVANADGSAAIPLSRSDRFDGFGVWRPTPDDAA